MNIPLESAVFWAGVGQLGVLIASALVPVRLRWRETLRTLPPLVRQLFWVYGGYVVATIVSLAAACLIFSRDLASGAPFARAVCIYGALFWGARLALQGVLSAKPYLGPIFLRVGYHALTPLFAALTFVYAWAALH